MQTYQTASQHNVSTQQKFQSGGTDALTAGESAELYYVKSLTGKVEALPCLQNASTRSHVKLSFRMSSRVQLSKPHSGNHFLPCTKDRPFDWLMGCVLAGTAFLTTQTVFKVGGLTKSPSSAACLQLEDCCLACFQRRASYPAKNQHKHPHSSPLHQMTASQ